MPKEKVREIDAIMEDMTLTEEEWRQEMTESYKSQYMQMPDIRRMEKEIKEIRENIAAAVQGEKPDPQLLKDLAEALEKADKKMAQAEKEIDEKVEGLVNDDREKRTEFAPESKKKEAPEKEEKEPEKEPEKEEKAPEKEEKEPEKEAKDPEKAPEKEEKKEAPKKEAPEKSLEELKKENEDTMEALRKDADMPQEEWDKKMHKAIEEGCLLENHDLFEEQNKKTRDLAERIDKMRKDLKEGDDKKPLEDLQKEMGDHLSQVSKDRNRVAAQVEDRYADEAYKRRENLLKPKQQEMQKQGKGETEEAKKLGKDIALTQKHEKKAKDDAASYSAEAEDPKPSIFQSAFLKAFSGWLPQTVFGLVGELLGFPGASAKQVRTVQVPLSNYGIPTFLGGAGDFTLPTGPDHVKDLFKPAIPQREKDSVVLEGGADTTGIFKQTEMQKEKASEVILQADKNADLDFDSIDHEAKKQAEQAGRMSYKPVRGKLKMEDLESIPHAEVEEKQPEVKEEKKPEKQPEKQPEKEQTSGRKSFSLKDGSKISKKLLDGVAHVEVDEAVLQKQEEQPAKTEEKPVKEETAKEEPSKEEKSAELKKPDFEMGPNIEKAFKLMDLMEDMLGHTGRGHKNSDKYDSMMSAMGDVKKTLSEELGGSFGSLMRDFGEMAAFKDVMRPGGPMDLAIGQQLAEVEKKTENYIREKTLNGNKRNMGSGLGNTRIKDALDAMDVMNPERAKELGANIDISVKQGKATKKMSYNELNERLKEGDEKAASKEKTKENADKKRKERDTLKRDPLMSKEEKSKQHGMRIK